MLFQNAIGEYTDWSGAQEKPSKERSTAPPDLLNIRNNPLNVQATHPKPYALCLYFLTPPFLFPDLNASGHGGVSPQRRYHTCR